MGLTKPAIGTRIRHVTFDGEDNGRYDYLATDEILGTVVLDPMDYGYVPPSMFLDVLFDDGTSILYMQDYEFEVVK